MLRPQELTPTVSAFAARTPTLLPATHTNSYALGSRDVLLIEPATPYEDEQRDWIEWARGLTTKGRRLIAIIATHHHIDHVSGIDAIMSALNLPVWAHHETAARVGAEKFARALKDGDELVLDGPNPETWSVLHTPGHAPGHICLWNEQTRNLVVGDMVASVGTILIAPGDGHMATYLSQLARLAALEATLGLPAHGDAIENPTALIKHYIAHRLSREAKTLTALQTHDEKGASLATLLPEAYADTAAHLFPIAALSLAAHLEKLCEEGLAREKESGVYVAKKRS